MIRHEEYQTIIDTYIHNYDKYKEGKIEFEYIYGELIFMKEDNNVRKKITNKKNKNIVLFGIYIYPEYRRQYLCRDILCYLIDACINYNNSSSLFKIHKVVITSVLSKILYEYLQRFRYHQHTFIETTQGWNYPVHTNSSNSSWVK